MIAFCLVLKWWCPSGHCQQPRIFLYLRLASKLLPSSRKIANEGKSIGVEFRRVQYNDAQPKKRPKPKEQAQTQCFTFGKMDPGETDYTAVGTVLAPPHLQALQVLLKTVGIDLLRDLAVQNKMPMTKDSPLPLERSTFLNHLSPTAQASRI